jgi:hypothetical protein
MYSEAWRSGSATLARTLAYGEAFLPSPSRRRVTLLLGADDGHVLWVNGAKVSEWQGRHTSEPDAVALQVALKKGWNRMLASQS